MAQERIGRPDRALGPGTDTFKRELPVTCGLPLLCSLGWSYYNDFISSQSEHSLEQRACAPAC